MHHHCIGKRPANAPHQMIRHILKVWKQTEVTRLGIEVVVTTNFFVLCLLFFLLSSFNFPFPSSRNAPAAASSKSSMWYTNREKNTPRMNTIANPIKRFRICFCFVRLPLIPFINDPDPPPLMVLLLFVFRVRNIVYLCGISPHLKQRAWRSARDLFIDQKTLTIYR